MREKKIKNTIHNKMREQKGAITLFVVVSMLFFVIVLTGIYVSSSNKVRKQEEEIKQIQDTYKQNEDINDIYEQRVMIDNTSPVINSITSTSDSITIKGEDDKSGLYKYAVTTEVELSEDDLIEFTEISKTKEFTINGLVANTTYYVWLVDKSQNLSEYKEIQTKVVGNPTISSDMLDSNIIYYYQPYNMTLTPGTYGTTCKWRYYTEDTTSDWYTGTTIKAGNQLSSGEYIGDAMLYALGIEVASTDATGNVSDIVKKEFLNKGKWESISGISYDEVDEYGGIELYDAEIQYGQIVMAPGSDVTFYIPSMRNDGEYIQEGNYRLLIDVADGYDFYNLGSEDLEAGGYFFNVDEGYWADIDSYTVYSNGDSIQVWNNSNTTVRIKSFYVLNE